MWSHFSLERSRNAIRVDLGAEKFKDKLYASDVRNFTYAFRISIDGFVKTLEKRDWCECWMDRCGLSFSVFMKIINKSLER